MAAKVKFQTTEQYRTDQTFMLRDISWAFLFPDYWPVYRKTASARSVAKLKVIQTLPDNRYEIELMEVAPEEGRIVVPIGMRHVISLHTLQVAEFASWKTTLT